MSLMAFETLEESNCVVNNIYKSIGPLRLIFKFPVHYFLKCKATYWGESQKSWWFAASDHCNEANWYWCYGNSQVRFFDKAFNPFGLNSPDPDNYQNVEHCALIRYFEPMQGNDITCGSYQSNYICEVWVVLHFVLFPRIIVFVVY
jgi:hypothetical protein